MAILLVLQEDVGIFKFFLTVVAKRLKHIDSSFLSSHFSLNQIINLYFTIITNHYLFIFRKMGFLDTVMGTAVSGFVAFKMMNFGLEKVFFRQGSALKKASRDTMLRGSLKD